MIKGRKVAGVLVASATLLSMNAMTTTHIAGADPAFASSYVGVGSDTIQDVFNAYSGAEPYPPSSATVYSVPLHSSAASNNKTVTSWDAIPAGGSAAAPGCITPKLGTAAMDRPNGSGNGIAALSHAVDGTGWQAPKASCTAGTSNATPIISGSVDFARSSRGPNVTGTALAYIPFARDAVGVAYYDHGTTTFATLTTAQLNALYSSPTGTLVINGDTAKACLPQAGSGTRSFFEGAIGVSEATANAAATAAGCNTQEENGADTFYAFANVLPAGTGAVIPFSAGSWISQANGVSLDRSATGRANGVDLAAIDALGKPYTGTPPNEAPSATYYANTSYGRNVYVVVPTSKIGTFGDSGLKSLFVGGSAQICASAAQTTANRFGFSSAIVGNTCGSTTLQGALYS
jgi:hypothetical protein